MVTGGGMDLTSVVFPKPTHAELYNKQNQFRYSTSSIQHIEDFLCDTVAEKNAPGENLFSVHCFHIDNLPNKWWQSHFFLHLDNK